MNQFLQTPKDVVEMAREHSFIESMASLRSHLENIDPKMLYVVNRGFRKLLDERPISEFRPKDDPIIRVASLAQIFFDCTMFLLG